MNKYIDPEYESLLNRTLSSLLKHKRSQKRANHYHNGAEGYTNGWIDALIFIQAELPELELKLDDIVRKRDK